MLWILLACQPEEDTSIWNHLPEPSAEPESDSGAPDPTEDIDPLEGYSDGDPIVFISSEPEEGQVGMGPVPEWITAAMADANTAVMAGQGFFGTIDVTNGSVLDQVDSPRGIHVDASDGFAVVSTRNDQIMLYDISDPTNIEPSITISNMDTPHEGIAIQGDRIFVAWRSEGLKIFNLEGELVSTLDIDDASVVDVHNNRAAVVDGERLLLLDISNTSAVSVLAEAELAGPAYDIALDESHVVVAGGTLGVEIFEVSESAMRSRGQRTFSGASQGVELDGEYLWVANWSTFVVMSLAGEIPVVLGEESPINSAFDVAAYNGNAVVADWYYSSSFQLKEGIASAEIHVPEELNFQQNTQSHQWFRVVNNATRELEVTFSEPTGGYVLNSSGDYTVPAGGHVSLSLATPSNGNWGDGVLTWTSNDADEQNGQIVMRPASNGMGSEHPDFELPQFSLAEGLIGNVRLSDFLGKVVFLSWWGDY